MVTFTRVDRALLALTDDCFGNQPVLLRYPSQVDVQSVARSGQGSRSDKIEQAKDQVKDNDKAEQRHQCGNRAAGQHPVIDLKHEQGAGQHQDVDGTRKQPDTEESRARTPQRELQRVFLAA